MNENRFITGILVIILFIMGWVQGRLEELRRADGPGPNVVEGLQVIARHGGILGASSASKSSGSEESSLVSAEQQKLIEGFSSNDSAKGPDSASRAVPEKHVDGKSHPETEHPCLPGCSHAQGGSHCETLCSHSHDIAGSEPVEEHSPVSDHREGAYHAICGQAHAEPLPHLGSPSQPTDQSHPLDPEFPQTHVHVCKHEQGNAHGHAHEHAHGGGGSDGTISTGMILILQHLGLNELAANLLWIQMDADSHAGLWHRVNFSLELIPVLDPHFVEAFLLRAFVLDSHEKKVDEAMALLERGIKSNPYRSELWVQFGVYALNFRQRHGPVRHLEKARQAFAQALRLPTTLPHVARFYAFTLAAMGKRSEAVGFLKAWGETTERNRYQKDRDREAIERIESGEEL
jgi:hypothetical protein